MHFKDGVIDSVAGMLFFRGSNDGTDTISSVAGMKVNDFHIYIDVINFISIRLKKFK